MRDYGRLGVATPAERAEGLLLSAYPDADLGRFGPEMNIIA